jgi:hypothetical protein
MGRSILPPENTVTDLDVCRNIFRLVHSGFSHPILSGTSSSSTLRAFTGGGVAAVNFFRGAWGAVLGALIIVVLALGGSFCVVWGKFVIGMAKFPDGVFPVGCNLLFLVHSGFSHCAWESLEGGGVLGSDSASLISNFVNGLRPPRFSLAGASTSSSTYEKPRTAPGRSLFAWPFKESALMAAAIILGVVGCDSLAGFLGVVGCNSLTGVFSAFGVVGCDSLVNRF